MHPTAASMSGRWGLFAHYISLLQNTKAKPNSLGFETGWDECVDAFNVDLLAEQVASTGASWFGFVMHQQTEFLNAPNATFERLTGIPRGQGTSHRDLPLELGRALRKYGVELMLYHTGEGPVLSKKAGDALGGIEKNKPLNETYFNNWLECLREDARRHAEVVRYWWIDGCYPGLGYTTERLLKVAELFHSETPDAALAMNYYGCGTDYSEDAEHIVHANWFIDPAHAVPGEDYSAGETNILGGLPMNWSDPGTGSHVLPQNKDAQWHLLAFLGKPVDPRMVYDGWGSPGCKYEAEWLKKYRGELTARGGALTLDTCVRRDGSMDPEQLRILRSIAK